MNKKRTIMLQFLTAIIFAITAVLNLIAHKWLLGVVILIIAIVYLILGVFYLKNYKG